MWEDTAASSNRFKVRADIISDPGGIVESPFDILNEDGSVASSGTYNSDTNNEFFIGANQKVVIKNISYNASYEVKEIDIPSGWTNTSNVNVSGKLTEDSISTITNKYDATGKAQISFIKEYTDGSAPVEMTGGEFEFTLMDSAGKVIETVKNDEEGNIEFSPLAFDNEDAGKTFEYSVFEVEGSGNSNEEIVYDKSLKKVNVKVVDNGDGTLSCTTEYVNGNVFVNTLNNEILLAMVGGSGVCYLGAAIVGSAVVAYKRKRFSAKN